MASGRRDFLLQSLGAALTALARPGWGGPNLGTELHGIVPFADPGVLPLERLVGTGLNGRRALDLSRLGPDTLVTSSERFFVRTRCPDRLPAEGPWKIRLRGLTGAAVEVDLAELLPAARSMGTHLIECAGNTPRADFGLMSAADWTGIPVGAVLERVRAGSHATRVLISGFDEHSRQVRDSQAGASWVFTLQELERSGAFLATGMNGGLLSRDHGYPLRLIVPGWYGCVCIKWVNELTLVDDSAPATGQMLEFASRTEQAAGDPVLARDFQPATVDVAALPVRVERWSESGNSVCRVVGILWGGESLVERLLIRFGPGEPFAPVDEFRHLTLRGWSLWSHRWRPSQPGRYRIELRVDPASTRARRLNRGFYTRTVELSDL